MSHRLWHQGGIYSLPIFNGEGQFQWLANISQLFTFKNLQKCLMNNKETAL